MEIWSDVVCPWCYIGKRRFETALAGFAHRDDVEVVWRSFELDPRAPRERPGDLLDHLSAKYGLTRPEAEAMMERVTEAGAAEGLELRLDLSRAGNTLDAHRLLHLAADHGLQDPLKERLLGAYLEEGQPIGDPATLERLAVEVGLPGDEVAAVLASDRYEDAVRADESEGQAFGVGGVPFFVLDRAYGVTGAQPAEVFTNVLERAWSETHDPSPAKDADAAEADACEGGACVV